MRYLPLTPEDRAVMLARVGVEGIDELFADVPQGKLLAALPNLPRAKSEIEVERLMGRLAAENVAAGSVPFFCGAGAYRHHVPATVDHLIQRSEFLTSYTPYQPEIAQGTLQYLFEFQTQVALITGMEVANASMYDGATAAAEAVLMAHRLTRRKKAVLAGNLHPHYRETIATLSRMADDELVVAPPVPSGAERLAALIDDDTSCVVVQTPDVFGHLHDLHTIGAAAHANGVLVIAVVTEAVSLGLVTSPGELGADIVVAEGQSLGGGLNFGGPYVGLFATRQKFVRQMPGRLAGETVDAEGQRGFVLTLSTREQHIRREKATSNICTNSGLCALAFTIHLTLLGEGGFRRLAELNHASAVELAEQLAAIPGVSVLNKTFFNEFTVKLPKPAGAVVEALAARGVLGGVPFSRLDPAHPEFADLLIVAATETTTADDRAALVAALTEVLGDREGARC
ncbi:aminomethyl-transferring glycine dehydrogenase subunit GcvPA [Blastochloris viridis]|uniref:Probable glycine dehydrogenase (decarboxylating) subunit 1 n=1 Tax=Blastochloris viridis TaxID=1079 RepID=A0A0H5BGU6_BLAVI|nr:aminomethyl-transferring glycine dehydrogenase subunit GcvPA [Blastochloris viridis]ALK10452.1 putative glycine dehydrogenase (decarboxylating) subunit 1 [Blastochloris viridis]BAR99606.1 glycine dehydrogenase [Blastochloris viridis]CUU43114.1 putative glycine dehydrogenase [decarboxylating]subunit 1 [Blastochloris viridis]